LFQSVLENLPGVDPGSESLQQAMGAILKKDEKKEEDKDKK
jgi:hypothetical protein